MFTGFLTNATVELAKKQFMLTEAVKDSKGKDAVAIFVKDDSPICYFVTVVNSDLVSPEGHEKAVSRMLSDFEKKNSRIFGNIINVNILYTGDTSSVGKFADAAESDRDGRIHNVWWYTDGKELYFGKGQPTKVYNIERYMGNALKAGEPKDGELKEIGRNAFEKNRIKPKTGFPIVAFVLIAINILIFLIQTTLRSDDLFVYNYGINGDLIFKGHQYYRLFTYMFIHSGVEHILLNTISLYIYGTIFEKYCGKMALATVYILSGLAGGLASAYFNGWFAVGASGAIFGLLAAILAVVKITDQSIGGLNYMTMLILAAVSIGMGFLNNGVDNYGHIGGFIGGLIAGSIVSSGLE